MHFLRHDGGHLSRAVFIGESYACLRLISDSVRQNTSLTVALLPEESLIKQEEDDESSDENETNQCSATDVITPAVQDAADIDYKNIQVTLMKN